MESAKIEADILQNIMKHDENNSSYCSKLYEYFYFYDDRYRYIVLVFERLGKSLYDFLKDNKYQGIYYVYNNYIIGFQIKDVQEFARQLLKGISFLHNKLALTHTDLKVFIYFDKFSQKIFC